MRSTLLMTLFMMQTGAASEATLSGIIYDPQRAAIPGARIDVVCGSDRRAVGASPAGMFSVKGLPSGTCTLTSAAPLFEPSTISIELAGHVHVALVLRLRPVDVEVTVSAQRGLRQDGFDVPRSVSTTPRSDLDARPYQLLPQVRPGVLFRQQRAS